MAPWLASRWERDTRYYELHLRQDLFGDWVLTRVWGGKGTALGQIRHELCRNYASGVSLYAASIKRREKHGYIHVNG